MYSPWPQKKDQVPSVQRSLDQTSPFRNGYKAQCGAKSLKPIKALPGVGKFTDGRGDVMYCRLDTEQVFWGGLEGARKFSQDFAAAQDDQKHQHIEEH